MNNDHNMNQTDSGWRKRQIALDKKAENARELGLTYESSNTIMEMAKKVEFEVGFKWCVNFVELEAFAKLVREDEREACAKTVEGIETYERPEKACFRFAAKQIRARKQA